MSVTYTSYLSTANSDYVGVYEFSGNYTGYSYVGLGNNSTGTGFWILYKFGSDFPYAGTAIGDYTVDSDDVTGAIIRLPEVNKNTRGSGTLVLKASAITGTWNGDAEWASVPTYSAVVDTYSSFGAIPSSSNYDTRYGYHEKQYKYGRYYDYFGTWAFSSYVYYSSYQGSVFYSGGFKYAYVSTIPAYYDYYYKYNNVNIVNVIKDAIDNNATGLLLYFDTTDSTFNRKIFTTPYETANSRRPQIVINFADEATAPPLTMGIAEGSIDKATESMSITTDGTTFNTVSSMMIAIAQGSIDKTVF